MTPPPFDANPGLRPRLTSALRARFSLKDDMADHVEIDQRLRGGVEMQGTQLWLLMFAIFIASVGLNVNSTAVIIGAMLISPLMGPITGIGYGAGIYDAALVRLSLKNLAIATVVALLVSTIYFLVSPLRVVQSELLARTTPSLWDVLIAMFGGLAGIVGATRREKTNVIPGVAIATALMPPLCTAGFGLSVGNASYFFGALYLFLINCVFIAATSALVVWAFHLPQKRFVDDTSARRVHRAMGLAVLLAVVPSLVLAYQLVTQELFKSRATAFVQRHLETRGSHVVSTDINAAARRIDVTLVGDVIGQQARLAITAQLGDAGLAGADLRIFQAEDQRVDVAALKSSLLSDLYQQSRAELEKKDKLIGELRAELAVHEQAKVRYDTIAAELHALQPLLDQISLAELPVWTASGGWQASGLLTVQGHSSRPLARQDIQRLEQWLQVRLKIEQVRVDVSSRPR
ncbi:MAG: hypothetical protein RIQ60_955 [Pseudomonadota bacterium]|jgi:uncharacterized hydrophobic protein (TIGR00271 family)